MGEKLTPHQIAVLEAMPKAERSKMWGRGPGRLSISAREACLRKRTIQLAMVGTLWTYQITDAGRAALSHQGEGSGDA